MQVEEIVKLKINVIEESSWRVQDTEFEREEQVKKYLRRWSRLPPSTLYTGRAENAEKTLRKPKPVMRSKRKLLTPGLPDFGLLREEWVLANIAGSFSDQQAYQFAGKKLFSHLIVVITWLSSNTDSPSFGKMTIILEIASQTHFIKFKRRKLWQSRLWRCLNIWC